MRETPGTLHGAGGGAAFGSTHWSVVLRSAESQAAPQAARAALEQLCQTYWPPLYSFVRRRGHSPADAQDFVQGFFAFLLASKAYARTDPAKGKFRSFLLASLKHYLADARDHAQALKRGGGRQFVPLDEALLGAEADALAQSTAADGTDEDRLFEQRWAVALVAAALQRTRAEYAAADKAPLFEALKPFVGGGVAALPAHDALAAQLGVPPVTLRSHIHRLRQRYRAALRAEIAHTVADPADIDEELRHLCAVLTAAPLAADSI